MLASRLYKGFRFLLDRLQESSTIQGIAAVLTLTYGYHTDPDEIGAWAAITAAITATLKIVLPDNLEERKRHANLDGKPVRKGRANRGLCLSCFLHRVFQRKRPRSKQVRRVPASSVSRRVSAIRENGADHKKPATSNRKKRGDL